MDDVLILRQRVPRSALEESSHEDAPLDPPRALRRTTRQDALDGSALGYHLTFRLEDDRTIAKTAAERRTAARILLLQGILRTLLAFFVADTHIHVLLACSRSAAGAFAHAVACALRLRLSIPVPFEPTHIRRIHDQTHFGFAHRYVLRQAHRHGLRPAIVADASSVADLCGLRAVDPHLADRVLAHFPRFWIDPAQAGLDPRALRDAPPDLDALSDAAAAALALVDLCGEDARRVAARTAAVHVGRAQGLRSAAIADRLEITSRQVRRLAERVPCPVVARAVLLQAKLRGLRIARAGEHDEQGPPLLPSPPVAPSPGHVAGYTPHFSPDRSG